MNKERRKLLVNELWRAAAAVIMGCITGVVGAAFVKVLSIVIEFRSAHGYMIYFMPVAGVLIVAMYAVCKYNDEGTDLVLCAARNERTVPGAVAPLIMCATILTQLVGGSAGREGAALQLGSGICTSLSKLFRVKVEENKRLFVLCGMSAGFSAVFGTPIAAAVFAIEVAAVGFFSYASLFPCVLASVSAYYVSGLCGAEREAYTILAQSDVTAFNLVKILILAILCGLLAKLFCFILGRSGKWISGIFKNPYVRVICCSVIFVIIIKLEGSTDFMGTGAGLIEKAIEGEAKIYSFVLKIIVTVLTLKGGLKGGEIVPSFSIGATFGCVLAPVFGLEPSMCAAVFMAAFFGCVTNCPITALLIAFELFGFTCAPFFLLAVAAAHFASGRPGLYHTQKLYRRCRIEKDGIYSGDTRELETY